MPDACPACGQPLEAGLCPACAGTSRLSAPPSAWPDTDPPGEPRTAPAVPPFASGETPPGYEVLGELGRGGMAVVFKARQTRLGRLVALKVIQSRVHADVAERARFDREARATAALVHPNIVTIHEYGEHAGEPYFALEFCPGGTLATRLSNGPLPADEAAKLVRALAGAVQAAHDAGVVHRDLKPGNVLFDAHGTPKVADFGLALTLNAPRQTEAGGVVGTPAYMAPEQAQGRNDVGPAADVYALGVILHECLTGNRPSARKPRHAPAVPDDLEAVVARCLQRDPAERYGSAAELAAALERRPAPHRRRVLLAAALGVALVALLVAGGIAAFGGRRGGPVDGGKEPGDAAKRGKDPEPDGKVVTNSIGMRFVRIPPGVFRMGFRGEVSEQMSYFKNAQPDREVEIPSAFYLGETEVTQKQYRDVMGENPSACSAGGKLSHLVKEVDTDDFPVEMVSWEDVQQFMKRLAAREGEKVAGRVYRLPSEAEWEYACRAGTRATDRDDTGHRLTMTEANFSDLRGKAKPLGRTAAVRSYKPNAFGLYDMHGNVVEWCADWYDKDYYKDGPRRDPKGPPDPVHGTFRVGRGGSWQGSQAAASAAWRSGYRPALRADHLGFRVVLEQ